MDGCIHNLLFTVNGHGLISLPLGFLPPSKKLYGFATERYSFIEILTVRFLPVKRKFSISTRVKSDPISGRK
jgi:hypothetical protein